MSSVNEEKRDNEEDNKSSKSEDDVNKPEDSAAEPSSSSISSSSETLLNDAVESIRNIIATKLGFNSADKNGEDKVDGRQILETVDMDGIIKHWKSGGFKRIITMVGAGISTSAGIPDFRSPGTGLYNNLKKYKLPYPTAIFEMDYFIKKPKPFFALAKELYPGTFQPTPCHYFVRLLHEKNQLKRHYTQNIDTLERIAGIPENKLVEAHGTFYSNHCLGCKKEYSQEWMKKKVFEDVIPTCISCNSLVKPDIVFFGENLPEKFYQLPGIDLKDCDLLIIMGTSLEVQPFASLIDRVNEKCVRLLINRDAVGVSRSLFGDGLHFNKKGNYRDVAWLGDCDEGILYLAKELGYKDDLDELMEKERSLLSKISEPEKSTAKTPEPEKPTSKTPEPEKPTLKTPVPEKPTPKIDKV